MSIRFNRTILLIIMSLVLSVVITGCKKTTGGGWIPVEIGNSKATLGYQANCSNISHSSNPELFVGQVKGQFQFKDHGQKIAFHGDIDIIPYDVKTVFTSCEKMAGLLEQFGIKLGLLLNSFEIKGTYRPIPKKAGAEGVMQILVADDEISTCSVGDLVRIKLQGGIHDGYSQFGCVEGGKLALFSI